MQNIMSIAMIAGSLLLAAAIVYGFLVMIAASKAKNKLIDAEIHLEEIALEALNHIDLFFVEEVSSRLQKAGFKWLGDYKVDGLKAERDLKLYVQDEGMNYYARYFIDEKGSTLGTIFFCKMYEKGRALTTYSEKEDFYMTAFYLKSLLNTGEVLSSTLTSRKKLHSKPIEKLFFGPMRMNRVYTSTQEVETMLMDHMAELIYLQDTKSKYAMMFHGNPEAVLSRWNHQVYRLDKKRYRPSASKQGYRLKWSAALKQVSSNPWEYFSQEPSHSL